MTSSLFSHTSVPVDYQHRCFCDEFPTDFSDFLRLIRRIRASSSNQCDYVTILTYIRPPLITNTGILVMCETH